MYTHITVSMYTYMHIYTCEYIRANMYMHITVSMFTHIHVNIYTYTCMCTLLSVCIHTHMYMWKYIHVHVHYCQYVYMHRYTHTHVCIWVTYAKSSKQSSPLSQFSESQCPRDGGGGWLKPACAMGVYQEDPPKLGNWFCLGLLLTSPALLWNVSQSARRC